MKVRIKHVLKQGNKIISIALHMTSYESIYGSLTLLPLQLVSIRPGMHSINIYISLIKVEASMDGLGELNVTSCVAV